MVRGRSYPQVVGLAIGADNHAYHDPCGRASGGPSRHCRIGRVNRRRHLNGTEGGWPSLSVADAMIKRVPHSSRTLRRVGTMQLAVPFFDFPENLIIQAARTRPCKKRKDGAPFSYFVPKILKAGPPAPKEGLSGPPTRGGNAFDTANQRRASGPNRSHNILWLCLCACGSSVHFNPFGARRGG